MYDNNTLVSIDKFVLVGTLKRRFIVWSKRVFCLMNHNETFVEKKKRNKSTEYVWWFETTSGSVGYFDNSHSCQDKYCVCRGYYCTTIKKLMLFMSVWVKIVQKDERDYALLVLWFH